VDRGGEKGESVLLVSDAEDTGIETGIGGGDGGSSSGDDCDGDAVSCEMGVGRAESGLVVRVVVYGAGYIWAPDGACGRCDGDVVVVEGGNITGGGD
jgi:hypothetical protein